jgi:transcriptional regulator with XRE-family HTH domain
MDICKRLRQIREAKGLSQGDIEERTGLFRCYVSRVECGFTVPQFATLERWVKALGISLSEFFKEGHEPPKPLKKVRVPFYEERLVELLKRLNKKDKRLLLSIASTMARQGGKNGR